MKKTQRMLEVEERFGQPLEELLQERYLRNKESAEDIAQSLGLSRAGLLNWVDHCNIPRRSRKEARNLAAMRRVEKKYGIDVRKTFTQHYVDDGWSYSEIGLAYGVAMGTVKTWLQRWGVQTRSAAETQLLKRGARRPTREELETYLAQDMHWDDIAKECKVNPATARDWLIKEGLHTFRTCRIPDREELRKFYEDDGLSTGEIAEHYGVSISGARKWLKKYGLFVGTMAKIEWPSDDELRQRYEGGESTGEIGLDLGVNNTTVGNRLRKIGVTLRTAKEAAQLARARERKNNLERAVEAYLSYAKDKEDPISLEDYLHLHPHLLRRRR